MPQSILKETFNIDNTQNFREIVLDGFCVEKLRQNIITNDFWTRESTDKLFATAAKAVVQFPDPLVDKKQIRKMLCLGKVQSGKTSFFIASIALAFDNDFNMVYVIGGAKKNLLVQNYNRIKQQFSNNNKVIIEFLNDINSSHEKERIMSLVKRGYKIILMVLKNTSTNSLSNLVHLQGFLDHFDKLPSLIIDDEGDEFSPGAPQKQKKGQIHSDLSKILNKLSVGVFLSVTATPQANLLLSIFDALSPDSCVLVPPGDDYTGAYYFHDTSESNNVEKIYDTDNFDVKIPFSFERALFHFIISTALWRKRNNGAFVPFSMLVHPSAYTKDHSNVVNKILPHLNAIRHQFQNKDNIGHQEIIKRFENFYQDEISAQIPDKIPFNDLINLIDENLDRIKIHTYNRASLSHEEEENISKNMNFYCYPIYVGGVLLERGITLPNLAVTYIYRESRSTKTNADTLFQRARWFGYKKKYIDLCKVYMTNTLADNFVTIAEHEHYLWNSLERFLSRNKNLQQLKRAFVLNDPKINLTRTSISKTVEAFATIKAGYLYEKSFDYCTSDNAHNKSLLQKITEYFNPFKILSYGLENQNKHFFYQINKDWLYNTILFSYRFPANAVVSIDNLEKLLKINNEKSINLIIMRPEINSFRTAISGAKRIKELPQGRNRYPGHPSYYPGDKHLMEDEISIQIHFINVNNTGNLEDTYPFFAISVPSDIRLEREVTGTNEYY